MNKKITAKIVGTGNPEVKDLKIKKGTTVADLKRELKVPQTFQVFRRQDNSFLNDGQDLYGLLEEHEKLEISPESTLGWLREKISSFIFPVYDCKVEVISSVPLHIIEIGPQTPQSMSGPVIRRPTLDIQPAEVLGLPAEMANIGWFAAEKGYMGHFKTRSGSMFQGKIVRGWKGRFEYFIKDPPRSIFLGRHKYCFSACGNGWYHIHFAVGERNNPVILVRTVQQYLDETGVSG